MSVNARSIRVKAGKKLRLGLLEIEKPRRFYMEALIRNSMGGIKAVAESDRHIVEEEKASFSDVTLLDSLEELLEAEIDGLVITSPKVVHVKQIVCALDRGISVFCQEPPAVTGVEARQMVDVARRNDCLLAVNFPYRHIKGIPELREHIRRGELGDVYALDLTFHNGNSLDECHIDNSASKQNGLLLGVSFHLVDLALWLLDYPGIINVTSNMFSDCDLPLLSSSGRKDYLLANIDFANGVAVQLSYSRRVSSGCDTVLEMGIYGNCGGSMHKNVNDSFFDFIIDRYAGTQKAMLSRNPDDWKGQGFLDWARNFESETHYDSAVERFVDIAGLVDRIYGR